VSNADTTVIIKATGRLRRDLLFFSVAGLVLVSDQITKSLIRATLAVGQSVPEDGFFRLTHVINTGAAFGILQGQGVLILVSTFIGVAAIILYYVFPPLNSTLLGFGLGLQLGGALGNLLDRVRYGHVTDFLDFRVWPVFNLADSAIVVGVALLVALVFLSERRQKGTREAVHDT
jgi:signal peptidase II